MKCQVTSSFMFYIATRCHFCIEQLASFFALIYAGRVKAHFLRCPPRQPPLPRFRETSSASSPIASTEDPPVGFALTEEAAHATALEFSACHAATTARRGATSRSWQRGENGMQRSSSEREKPCVLGEAL